jgi:hypothetical protein
MRIVISTLFQVCETISQLFYTFFSRKLTKKQSEPKRVSRAIDLKDCNQLCVDDVKRLIMFLLIVVL